MKTNHRCLIAFVASLCFGCARDMYRIEISPENGALRRSVICWHEKGPDPPEMSALAEEELQRLEAIYGPRQTVDDGPKYRFEGLFHDALPNDVGGSGSYTHWQNPLGSLEYYVERFRGDDDLEAGLAARREAAATLADLIVGWAETELADKPGFAHLRRFLEHDLRRDLTNLGIYTWQSEAAAIYEEHVGGEFLVRALQYLVERDYLGPRDIPALYAAAVSDDFQPAARIVKRLVLRELKTNDRPPESLEWLGDPQRLKDSFANYVRTTDFYKERAAQRRRTGADGAEQEPPVPADVLAELRDDWLSHFEAPGDAATVELTLVTVVEPFATNGEWVGEAEKVRWSGQLERHRALPLVCFAAWSRPDGGAQKKHFGKIVLEGAELAQYVLWYEALPGEKRPQWDALLERLPTADDVAGAVRQFRFDGEPAYRPDVTEDQQPESRADEPRRLILQGLDANPSGSLDCKGG